MSWKSVLKPEGSVIAGLATVGAVYGLYQLNIGNVSTAHASDANHPALETSRKKAGYEAYVLVGALTLLTKDANVGVLGFLTICGMEIAYRHGIMADPLSGKIQNPNPVSAYEPAENVVPIYAQGEAA